MNEWSRDKLRRYQNVRIKSDLKNIIVWSHLMKDGSLRMTEGDDRDGEQNMSC